MYEWQFSLSKDGKFLFRTEWDSDKDRVQRVAEELWNCFSEGGRMSAGYKLIKSYRNTTQHSEEL